MMEGEEKEGRAKQRGERRKTRRRQDNQMDEQVLTSVNKQGCGCCIRFLDSLGSWTLHCLLDGRHNLGDLMHPTREGSSQCHTRVCP